MTFKKNRSAANLIWTRKTKNIYIKIKPDTINAEFVLLNKSKYFYYLLNNSYFNLFLETTFLFKDTYKLVEQVLKIFL